MAREALECAESRVSEGRSEAMTSQSDHTTNAVASAFTAISDHYSSHFIPARTGTHLCFRRRLELVMKMTEGRKGAFLDCAVGPAEITGEVLRRERFDRALLLDISPVMIAKANQRLLTLLPVDNMTGVYQP